MTMLLLNVLLALVYVTLTEDGSFFNLMVGFLIGMLIVSLVARAMGRPRYTAMILRRIRFMIYFLVILTKANWQVALAVLKGPGSTTPRLFRYPVTGLTPVQITTLANAITLTPGTLTTDADETGDYLLIHGMFAGDEAKAVAEIDELRDALLKGVFS